MPAPLVETFVASLSGLLLAFSFPRFNHSFLAWIALFPLLRLNIVNARRGLILGGLTGLVANLVIYYWLIPTFQAAQIGILTALVCWILLSFLLAAYLGLFYAFYVRIPFPWMRPWLGGAAWVALEHVRTHLLTGFPWASISHTQAYHPMLLQFISITGAGGLSFLIVAVNASLAELHRLVPERKFHPAAWRKFVIGLGCLAALIAVILHFGFWRLRENEPRSSKIRVALLQGNIDQYAKWDARYEADIRQTYESLALEAATQKPDLVVWPESAVPGWLPNDPFYVGWVSDVVKKTGVDNVVGAIASMDGRSLNSAFHLNGKGEFIARYDKIHLVPFGEFNLFGHVFDKWIPYLGQLGTFDPGDQPVLFEAADVWLSPNICYEAIFADLVRESIQPGADVILNITNDGWYLKTAAPEQHLVANVFRAVENGRPVIRAANTGISALIDGKGRFVLRSPLMQRGCFLGELPLIEDAPQTPFTKFGNWFTYLCWLGVGFFLVILRRLS